ncbi:MAG: glycosyltransferase family 2 protein [Clostridia bacterium]
MSKNLIIIPAYNEAENIEKVINEIKKDISYADIVVINDCSKDNTKQIVEKNGIKCITVPFNLGYARAVQTGIKYAKENDYDYVMQFDADGQHIASEAARMLKHSKETNCDIVIGSRYLEKGRYQSSFFRKLGTVLFSLLIKMFSGKKITDPLSGFQCLNKKVIDRYSKIGGYPEYPDANLVLEMIYEGYTISEIPVSMRQREFGESMHGGIIKPIKYMIKMFYEVNIILLKNLFRKKVK